MIRAAMEGVCYSLNSVLLALRDFGDVQDIRVSGSFTKSPLWLQIMADVFGEKLTLPDNSEGAAFGAAVLGFISTGIIHSIEDTASLIQPKKIYTPQMENAAVYAKLYDIYDRLYWNVQQEFADLVAYQKTI
jgi:gluconokinase